MGARMGFGWVRYAAAAVISLSGLAPVAASADDASAWRNDRLARFATYHAAHPNPDAEIAKIKAKTQALIKAAKADTALAAPTSDTDPLLDPPPVIWRASAAPLELWDGPDYPQMVVVPAGEYTMGSSVTEAGHQANEGPRRRVRVGYSLAVSKYPVTVGEFAQFVAETGYDPGNQCYALKGEKWDRYVDSDWRRPGYDQTSQFPAVCTNASDAEAYVAWLSHKTGHSYRLLSEAEYEYVSRAGSTTAYSWGDDPAAACAYANGFDQDARILTASVTANSCHDGYVFASPVGSFKPNAFGLYDTAGNIWSWLADCGGNDLSAVPSDGSAITGGDCRQRMLRGGAWYDGPLLLRSAQRLKGAAADRGSRRGFRVARTL
ncbi:MAG TPA: SUMF1/EgtB/PvdO family nonheme iron enzyme [Caulobacteraceae bacterium]|nr:SUMF1/EgtB/PvdO family nonheme iron enzyme [Caulobacteraceae bacterium]